MTGVSLVIDSIPISYTPTDGSGAGLTFTGVSGFAQRNGHTINVWGRLVYPATADGSQAKINVPVTIANKVYNEVVYTVSTLIGGSLIYALPVRNTSTLVLVSNAIVPLTNAQMTGASVVFHISYSDV